jgi:Protein of unknown function (DUF3617)
MKRVFFLTPLALAAMTGCAPAPNQIQAGQWELVTEVLSLDVPGATPDQQRQIRQQVGVRQSPPPQCISETEARTLVENMRRAPPNCRVTDEVYAGGVMRTRLNCPAQAPGQPSVSLAFDGTFTRTTFNATITEEGPNPTGASQSPMRRTQRISARRVGECTAAPPAPTMPAELPPAPANSAAPANAAAPAGH